MDSATPFTSPRLEAGFPACSNTIFCDACSMSMPTTRPAESMSNLSPACKRRLGEANEESSVGTARVDSDLILRALKRRSAARQLPPTQSPMQVALLANSRAVLPSHRLHRAG